MTTDKTTNDLIMGVEEAERQERLETLWKTYGGWIITGAVMLILGTAASASWTSWSARVKTQDTAQILAALEAEDPAVALDNASSGLQPGPRAVARLAAAGMTLQLGETQAAHLYLGSVARDEAAPAALRDLARLTEIRAGGETVDIAQAVADLEAIAADENAPFRHQARLVLARLQAETLKDRAAAAEELAALEADPEAPPALKEMAAALRAVYTQEGAE